MLTNVESLSIPVRESKTAVHESERQNKKVEEEVKGSDKNPKTNSILVTRKCLLMQRDHFTGTGRLH